jgi:hypothetical protein
MDQGKLTELLEFQINRNVINLYKSFLVMMEDMHYQHTTHFEKLKNALPEEETLLEQANYWDEDTMDFLRKKILDNGNNALREIVGQLEQLQVITK